MFQKYIDTLYLTQEEPLSLPILSLSRHGMAHEADDYRWPSGLTRGRAWEPWPCA